MILLLVLEEFRGPAEGLKSQRQGIDHDEDASDKGDLCDCASKHGLKVVRHELDLTVYFADGDAVAVLVAHHDAFHYRLSAYAAVFFTLFHSFTGLKKKAVTRKATAGLYKNSGSLLNAILLIELVNTAGSSCRLLLSGVERMTL